jgi:hypothetical protein
MAAGTGQFILVYIYQPVAPIANSAWQGTNHDALQLTTHSPDFFAEKCMSFFKICSVCLFLKLLYTLSKKRQILHPFFGTSSGILLVCFGSQRRRIEAVSKKNKRRPKENR